MASPVDVTSSFRIVPFGFDTLALFSCAGARLFPSILSSRFLLPTPLYPHFRLLHTSLPSSQSSPLSLIHCLQNPLNTVHLSLHLVTYFAYISSFGDPVVHLSCRLQLSRTKLYHLLKSQSSLMMNFSDIRKQIEPYFVLNDEKLIDIVKHFRKEMEEGLANYGKDMAMIPTFVTGVPNGTEEGWVSVLL